MVDLKDTESITGTKMVQCFKGLLKMVSVMGKAYGHQVTEIVMKASILMIRRVVRGSLGGTAETSTVESILTI